MATPAAFSSPGGTQPDSIQGDASRLRILVVDDSESIRQLIEQKLHDLARDGRLTTPVVELACDGEQAVAMNQEAPYDLVFLDVEMPGMGGREACRHLKSAGVPRVAMLSSRTSASDHQAGHEAGCDNYLCKPPADADLRVILRLAALKKRTSG